MFRSLILLSHLWKLITWLFISIFIRRHNFSVIDEKLTVKLLTSGIGLQKCYIDTDHAD